MTPAPRLVAGALLLMLVGGCSGLAAPSSTPELGGDWKPVQGLTWQVQLSGALDESVPADVYDIDGQETSAQQIAALQRKGARVVCYFSAGSVEDWRPDAQEFPAEVVGADMVGWPGERWLDLRRQDVLLPLMDGRLDALAAKGCDGVDPDNVDQVGKETGFAITEAEQIDFIRALAGRARERGLAFGLKNAPGLSHELIDDVDFAVNEQCHEYDECGGYDRFLAAGKPVVNIEYSGSATQICRDVPTGMYILFKDDNLGPARRTC